MKATTGTVLELGLLNYKNGTNLRRRQYQQMIITLLQPILAFKSWCERIIQKRMHKIQPFFHHRARIVIVSLHRMRNMCDRRLMFRNMVMYMANSLWDTPFGVPCVRWMFSSPASGKEFKP